MVTAGTGVPVDGIDRNGPLSSVRNATPPETQSSLSTTVATFTSQVGATCPVFAIFTKILGAPDRWHGCWLTSAEIGLIPAHVLACVHCPCLCRIGVCVQLLRASGFLMRFPLARAATGRTRRDYAGPALPVSSASHHHDAYGNPFFQNLA